MKTMTLLAGVVVTCGRLYAQAPESPAPLPAGDSAAPSAEAVADATTPPLVEPVTELPRTPGPTIDSITLFPNQAELPGTNAFTEQRFGYVLYGQASAQYDSNIFIQPTNAQADFIFTITPGVAAGFGDFKSEVRGADRFRFRFERFSDRNYFFLSYAPTFMWFAKNSNQDTVNQDARLQGEWTFQKLTVGTRVSFVTSNAPSEDIGNRVETTTFSAGLFTRYQLTGKTSVEINGSYGLINYTGNYVDSRQWLNEDWINYELTPKTTVSLGAVFGYLERSPGPSDTFQQAQLRVLYRPSEKLTLGLVAGPEFRQTEGLGDETNGVFVLNVEWAPAESAVVQLEAYNRVIASGAVGDDYIATGVRLQYRQRLFQRVFFDLAGGYQHSDYDGSTEVGRKDDLYFVRPGVAFGLTSWMTCELAGEYRTNDSTYFDRTFEETKATVVFNLLF